MFCEKCGSQINDDSKFCEICGTIIESKEDKGLSNIREEIERLNLDTDQMNQSFHIST